MSRENFDLPSPRSGNMSKTSVMRCCMTCSLGVEDSPAEVDAALPLACRGFNGFGFDW